MTLYSKVKQAIAIDTETTQYAEYGAFAATPHSPANWPAYLCYKCSKDAEPTVHYFDTKKACQGFNLEQIDLKGLLIVGQNLKFDLAYLENNDIRVGGLTIRDLIHTNLVWDTQVAEYIITAQEHSMASLDDLSIKYGGVLKDDRLSKLFKEGVSAEKISPDIIIPYVKEDVNNTLLVAGKQYQVLKEQNQLKLFYHLMKFYVFSFVCEQNGMYVDVAKLEDYGQRLKQEVEDARMQYVAAVKECHGDVLDELCNPASSTQVSAHLFGGELKNKEVKPVINKDTGQPVRYTSKTSKKYGEIKTKVTDVFYPFNPILKAKTAWANNNGFGTGDDIIQDLLREGHTHPLLKSLVLFRTKSKEYSSYIYSTKGTALLQLITSNSLIHPSYQLCLTKTGRTSCREPNTQNISSDAEIKTVFTSRWGKDGRIVIFDYSQLEVIVLAYLAKDPKFTQDIIDGTCFHCKRAAWASEQLLGRVVDYTEMYQKAMVEKIPEYIAARKAAKGVTFARNYGGGAVTISSKTGIPVDVVQLMIEKEAVEYPKLNYFYKALIELVGQNVVHGTHDVFLKDSEDEIIGKRKGATGYYTSITSRKYAFKQYQKFRENKLSFKPQDIKNYPVQGLATADIVPIILGMFNEYLYSQNYFYNKCIPINHVHDSVIMDVHLDVINDESNVINILHNKLEQYIVDFNKEFGIADWKLPFKVDVSIQENWKE